MRALLVGRVMALALALAGCGDAGRVVDLTVRLDPSVAQADLIRQLELNVTGSETFDLRTAAPHLSATGVERWRYHALADSTDLHLAVSALDEAGTLTMARGEADVQLRPGATPVTLTLLPPGSVVGGACPPNCTQSDVQLRLIIRDFRKYSASDSTTNPDFENTANGTRIGDDREIVTDTLGSDDKPVYKGTGATNTTAGPASFSQWYNDVPGTNLRVEYPLTLTKKDDGTYSYDSGVSGVPLVPGTTTDQMFFPIDDGTSYATAFGNQGDPHNYSFTVEAHTEFTYHGGETFHYRGDDDVFVYIDKKLVINLGGIHDPATGDLRLDDLGLTTGQKYPLDFFFAERHQTGSNLLITTSLALSESP